MEKGIKIAIIGAGSTYSPELMEGFINHKNDLPLKELYLMDIDDRKLEIVGGLCQRMFKHAEMDTNVVLTKDLDRYLKNKLVFVATIIVIMGILTVIYCLIFGIIFIKKLIHYLSISRCIMKIIPTTVIVNTQELEDWIESKY